jgi:hypothetical protein
MHFGISSSTAVMLVIVLEICNFDSVDAVVLWVQRTEMLWTCDR